MAGLKDLLLNLLIIFTPVFVMQIFWMSKLTPDPLTDRYNKVMVGFCSAISGILCISFPINLPSAFSYDLSMIPLFLCFLYADRMTGLLVALLLLSYHDFLHASEPYYLLLSGLAIPLTLWFLAPRYRGWIGRKKWLFVLQFSLFSSLFLVFVMIQSRPGVTSGAAQSMVLFWTYVLLHLVTTLLLVLLIEGFLKGSSLRAELFRSEKLNILSELAASVAHEIRNPMTTARGFMQLLKEQSSPDVFKKQMYCDMVIQELDRAHAVINDYMSLAKPHIEKMEVLELGEQAALLVNMLSPFAMIRNVEMEKDLPSTMVTIYANPEKFNQCMVNLMRNGIESMEHGGLLRFAIGTSGDMAVIDVIDNGVGMTEMEVRRLGEPFYSTKQKGTGLGMMLCFRIIDSLGGKIEITSKKGKGTHCRVLIPLYKS